MATSLEKLIGPVALTTTAATTLYTAPGSGDDRVAIRSIRVCNETGTERLFRLSIGTDGAGKRLWYDVPVPPGDPYDWNGNVVLHPGEVIQASASANTALTLTVSGVTET